MDDDAAARPGVDALVALPTDAWAQLLPVALGVLRDLPELHTDDLVKRVAAVPPGRLMSGRSRRDLARVLVRAPVWERFEAALPQDAARAWEEPVATSGEPELAGEVARLQQRVEHLGGREETLAARVADLRGELEQLRRERDGAVARAARAGEVAERARSERDRARADADQARAEADAADDRVAREVARHRRRDDAEVQGLEQDLRTARREVDQLRRQLERAEERAERAEADRAATSPPRGRQTAAAATEERGRRGRPSRLPADVAPGTTRAAEWLVAPGRVLLVDGYNVTRTQRPGLAFDAQRRWLEQAVSALAQRRHVDATIIWDARRGNASTRRTPAGVTVRFADARHTADDELVLHVELALDPDTPVVVVTDDTELRTRLAQYGVDLLDSQSFTWLL